MSSNFYLQQKVVEMHRQELLQEAERERLLAQLPRHHVNVSSYIAGKLGTLLLWLGGRLKQSERLPGI